MPKRRAKTKAPDADDSIPFRRRRTELKVRRRPGENAWELVHPRCALARSEDLDEVQHMLDAGEIDIAIDELRWLLDGCSDFVAAHRLLGELALADHDLRLARGHFGYAFEIGLSAVPTGSQSLLLSYRFPANQAFFEAGQGLALALAQLNKPALASSVLREMLKLDPTDPLKVAKLLADLSQTPPA